MDKELLGYILLGALTLAACCLTLWFEERRMKAYRDRWQEHEARRQAEFKAVMDAADAEEQKLLEQLGLKEEHGTDQRAAS